MSVGGGAPFSICFVGLSHDGEACSGAIYPTVDSSLDDVCVCHKGGCGSKMYVPRLGLCCVLFVCMIKGGRRESVSKCGWQKERERVEVTKSMR